MIITDDLGGVWGESRRILENLGEAWKISEKLGKSQRSWEKLGESWRVSKGGRAFANSFWGAFAKRPYIM